MPYLRARNYDGTGKNRASRPLHSQLSGCHGAAVQRRRPVCGSACGPRQPSGYARRRHAGQLAGRRHHLLHRMAGALAVDGTVVQGEARDAGEAEAPRGPLRRVARAAVVGTHRGRRHHARPRLLQDAPRHHRLPHRRGQVRPLCPLDDAADIVRGNAHPSAWGLGKESGAPKGRKFSREKKYFLREENFRTGDDGVRPSAEAMSVRRQRLPVR